MCHSHALCMSSYMHADAVWLRTCIESASTMHMLTQFCVLVGTAGFTVGVLSLQACTRNMHHTLVQTDMLERNVTDSIMHMLWLCKSKPSYADRHSIRVSVRETRYTSWPMPTCINYAST